jgi:hypothetical protein
MNRAGVLSIVLAAVVTGACGGADDVSSTPTGPSSTPSAPSSQPQPTPQSSCVPTNLRVVSTQSTVVTLAWNAVSGATEYLVLVGSAPSSSDILLTNTTSTTHTWTSNAGRQWARVQAKCNGSFGGSSNEVEYSAG